jgi:flagellum-specific peptidoglycan hydrolase FlgJ
MHESDLGAAMSAAKKNLMTPAKRGAFIASIAPAAQQTAAQFGVPASVTIAQAILESSDRFGNWGQSQLALQANNFFGIKARRADDYAEFRTAEFRNGHRRAELARFRKFPSESACFAAHAELLAGLERYRPAMAEADDPFVFAARLGPSNLGGCGYSTNPEYAKELASLITEFRLTRYDVKAAVPVSGTRGESHRDSETRAATAAKS